MGMRVVSDKQCLAYADSMMERGRRINDRNAVLHSREISTLYYSHFDDIDKLHQEAEALRKEAKANENMRMYFFAYSLEIQNRLIYDQTLDALKHAKEMATFAQSTKSNFGNFSTFRALGIVYYTRQEYKKATEAFDSALVYANKTNGERRNLRLSSVYSMLGYSLSALRKWDKADEAYEMGYKVATTTADSLSVLLDRAITVGGREEAVAFAKLYVPIVSLYDKLESKFAFEEQYNIIRAYNCLFSNQYDEAEQIASRLSTSEDKLRLLRNISTKRNDFASALTYENQIIELKDSLYNRLTYQDIFQLNKQLNNNDLRRRAQEQDAELLHMQIVKAQQEHEQAEMRAHAVALQEEAERKQAKEEALKSQALINDMQIKRVKQEQEQLEMAENVRRTYFINIMMGMMAFLFASAIAVVVIWLRRSHKTNQKLAVLTKELADARNEALETNKIKTVFIQNMSHEIRTQLNAVTGFAQILSSKDIQVTEEERLEYGNHITNNAMVLNTLIDDILALANKESSKSKQENKETT